MKKIVVVSDSHGLTQELYDIYQKYKGVVDYFIHCGDSELAVNHELFKIYKSVQGNCDERHFEKQLNLNVLGKKIFMTHGHFHQVKYKMDSLYYAALEQNADIVCFGHTHYPTSFVYQGILFVNPGSVYANRGVRGKTMAIITIDEKMDVTFIDINTFKPYKIDKN